MFRLDLSESSSHQWMPPTQLCILTFYFVIFLCLLNRSLCIWLDIDIKWYKTI